MSSDLYGFEALSPVSFLRRSGVVHAERSAVRDRHTELRYEDLYLRSQRLAGLLAQKGVVPGDRVSVLAPNSGVFLEAHFGIPMAGAVINALNTRLSAGELAYILDHAEPTVLIVDAEFRGLADQALSQAQTARPVVIGCGATDSAYEIGLLGADLLDRPVENEQSLLALNYTSGTTGQPKGVTYSHRGAYLQALAMIVHCGLDASTKYLWTLPMFHCNGWCFPWAVTAAGGCHLIVPRPDPDLIWDGIHSGATHLSAAPTVLTRLVSSATGTERVNVRVTTGGAPPSPTLLANLSSLGIDVTHLYGMTETYGPAAICDWKPEWDALDAAEQSSLKSRQGVSNVTSAPIRVVGAHGVVPPDGVTVGEIQLRGNNVMTGYYRDPESTRLAFDGEWLRTGDLGVMHPDGYVELVDRLKDIIVTGGENVASVEVEQALETHPAVLECAVVGVPDPEWGERVVAYVTLTNGGAATESELIDHVKNRIARYKAPRQVIFGELPQTATGKIQKFRLRESRTQTH